MVRKTEKALKMLEKKEERLKKVLNTGYPVCEAYWEAHANKMSNARRFLQEVQEMERIFYSLTGQVEVYSLVPDKRSKWESDDWDWTIYFNGVFCKMVIRSKYSEAEKKMIETKIAYIATLKQLSNPENVNLQNEYPEDSWYW